MEHAAFSRYVEKGGHIAKNFAKFGNRRLIKRRNFEEKLSHFPSKKGFKKLLLKVLFSCSIPFLVF